MTVSETNRLDMLVGLRMYLGDSVANTLIEHLPPGGWQDVARIADTDRLQRDVNRLHDDFAQLRWYLSIKIQEKNVPFFIQHKKLCLMV